jgi:predicted nuclease with RNAse H fold
MPPLFSPPPTLPRRVAGIDVGGPKKGFHAVVIEDGARVVSRLRTRDAEALADWCVDQGAQVVGVDAPCRWRGPGAAARAPERHLAREGIACYFSPTEARAKEHSFYRWMLPGAALYAALNPRFPLYAGGAATPAGPVVFETFPQAVACALAGQVVSAKEKRTVRGDLLRRAGFPPDDEASMDELDAVLCALAADAFARGDFFAYGDTSRPEDGFIIVPGRAL